MDTAPKQTGFAPGRLQRISDHINRNYIEPGKIPGCQVLVARHGLVSYFESFGQMDLERSKPLQDDTIFRIYSMTKPITSVALMQLYEKGYFQLNDPVHRVIPSWRGLQVHVSGEGEDMQVRSPDRPVTFRHVLNHSAGLGYGGTRHPVDRMYRHARLRDPDSSLSEFVEALGRIPLHYEPGTRWMYSYATDVCGYLVEALSGQPFDEYLREHILDPLGMKDTDFHVSADKLDRFAANYQRNASKELTLIDDPGQSSYAAPPKFLSGGGGLTGTTADYLRFCEMLRRGGELDGERILGPRTIRLMARNHLPEGRDLTQMAIGAFSETANEGVGFGLGFAVTLDEVAAGTLGSGDYYWGGAASTIFWVDPKEDLVVIFMTQLMPSATFNFRGQLKSLVYSALID